MLTEPRRSLFVALAALLALGFSGCIFSPDEEPDPPPPPPPEILPNTSPENLIKNLQTIYNDEVRNASERLIIYQDLFPPADEATDPELPGFLFLVGLRACLAGTRVDPSPVLAVQSATSVGNVLEGLGFLVLCYFSGWLLRGVRWPNVQPDESPEFRTMYQRVRLQHPESGFRIVKLRAEARLLE